MANQSECVEMRDTCNQGENKKQTSSSVFVLERKLQGVSRTDYIQALV